MQSPSKPTRWPIAVAIVSASVLLVGMLLIPKRARSKAITNVAISASGKWVAAGTRDGLVKVCGFNTAGQCRTVSNGGSELNDLQFSPDERILAVADDNIRLLAVSTGNECSFLRDDKLGYGTVRFDSSGSELVTINSQSHIEVINLRSKRISTDVCCSSFYGEVSFVGSELKMVNAGHWPRIWTRTGELIRALAPDRATETLRPIVVDEAGKRVFMGSQNGRVYAWSLANFQLIDESPAQAAYVDTIALVPKLGLLAYSGFEKEVHLWQPETSRTPETLGANSSSNVVAVPDGVSIAFGTDSGTIQIWTLEASPHLRSEIKVF